MRVYSLLKFKTFNMKKDKIIFLFFLSLIIGIGCKKKETEFHPKEIKINLEEAKDIEILPERIIPLETTDSSLIYDIGAMAVYDNELVIQSRSFMKVFDRGTGHYLRDISCKGDGPGEYLSLTQFWNDGDTLKIIDFNAGLIRSYMREGLPLVETVDLKTIEGKDLYQPQYVVETPDKKGYCVINCFRGGVDYNPQFSFLTKDFKFKNNVPGRELHEGGHTPDRMYTDFKKNRILAWEQLRDTLFQVDENGVTPLYVFNFGKHSFPEKFQSLTDLWERSQEFMKNKDGVPYASFIKYYQTSGDNLFFSFITSTNDVYLGRYNEAKDQIKIFRLNDPQNKYRHSLFYKIIDNGLLIALSSLEQIESNPSLYFLKFSEIE